MRLQQIAATVLAAVGLAGAAQAAAPAPTNAELLTMVQQLQHRVDRQEDVEAIRNLQYTYNYYNSSRLYGQVADLISEHAGDIEIAGRGVYHGKKGFLANFHPGKDGKPADTGVPFGFVLFQLAGQDVIHVADDGLTAQARVRVLTSVYADFPKTHPRFNGGDYEMKYVKEDGKWMIGGFKYVHNFTVTYDTTVKPGYSEGPDGKADAPTTWYHPWPETGVLAFHFPNPITGKYPPDVTSKEHYWVGNWPGEFGQTGHK